MHVAVLQVALRELLRHERQRRNRRDQPDLHAKPAIAPEERADDSRDEPQHRSSSANADDQRRVVEIAVAARREQVFARVRVRHRCPIPERVTSEQADHRQRQPDRPHEMTPHTKHRARHLRFLTSCAGELRIPPQRSEGQREHQRGHRSQGESIGAARARAYARFTISARMSHGSAGVRCGNAASRTYPAGSRRKLPQRPGNPRTTTDERPCSCGIRPRRGWPTDRRERNVWTEWFSS